jgi:hypothetical protein
MKRCDNAINARMARTVMLALLLIAALIAGKSVSAQSDGCLHRAIPVNVLTEQGEMVTGLTPMNFKASLDRKPVKFISVAPDQSPQRAVIAIDASASMTEDRAAWQFSLDVARDFVAGLPAGTEAGLAVFSTRVLTLIPPATDRRKLNDELARLKAEKQPAPKKEGKTALWDSLSDAAFHSIPLHDDDLLYVFTDGDDTVSKMEFKTFRSTLSEKQIRLFAFTAEAQVAAGIGPQTGAFVIPTNGLQNLQDLADSTGGYALHVSRDPLVGNLPVRVDKSGQPTAQGKLLHLQFQQAYSFNRVQVELPVPIKKPQEWYLNIRGLTGHNLAVVYPRRLASCAAP